jgi:hypothetical protein
MAHNVSHIPEGGEFETLNYQLTMNKIRSTSLHFSNTPPSFGYMLLWAAVFINLINLKK